MPQSLFKSVPMKPLTGVFDNRSNVDETPPGSFRWIENFSINADGKLARAKGFTRAAWDFHDQGVGVTREPITMFFPSTENDGNRRLFSATKTRILFLNETNGVWSTIGQPFGNDGFESLTQLRFNAAELQNIVVFTNDWDPVKYYQISNGTFGDEPSLALTGETGAINVSRARRVVSWNNVILLLNTVEGGIRYASRIRWSHLNTPLWFRGPVSPHLDSIADYQDLDYGHTILNAIGIGNALYVFCDRSIWRCVFVVTATETGSDVGLNCVKVYDEPKNRAKCLVFPNTLISDGQTAYYMGNDGWYAYTPGQMSEPDRPEWAHRSTKIIFDGAKKFDALACASPVSEYRPDLDTIYLSWGTVTADNTGLNEWTMAFNLKHKTSSFLDYGSVAYANFQPDSAGTGGCNTVTKLLASNPVDWTVKELNVTDAREYYDPATGLYRVEGYWSILRFLFPFDKMEAEKEIQSFLAEIVADNPEDVAMARVRIGTSDRVVDVNEQTNGNCKVLWHLLSSKPIRCSYTMSPEAYVAANIRPNPPTVEWEFLYRGRFLYCELKLTAPDGISEPTTGSCAVSRFQVEARLL